MKIILIILIVLMVCGQPDTIIVKYPNKPATYTHNLNQRTLIEVKKILQQDPVIISYEEDRGICT